MIANFESFRRSIWWKIALVIFSSVMAFKLLGYIYNFGYSLGHSFNV
jgi:hypothetical protein